MRLVPFAAALAVALLAGCESKPLRQELPQQHQGRTLSVRACEREALTDLAIVLRLADQGRIQSRP